MFNPARLAHARLRRGMTKVDLSRAVDLTPRRIAAYENEGETPPAETLSALADALEFPEGFFERPSPPSLEKDRVSFRSLSRLSASSRDRALAGAMLATELASWIEERFETPSPALPDLRDVEPDDAAAALRSMWGLGEMPAPNMVQLLEVHGVGVFSLTDDCAALDALSAWIDDRPFIFLTHHKSPERARWDAAHELGHLVLHLDVAPQGRDCEREADEFARGLLLPERGVLARASRYPTLETVREQKVFWRVSALAYIRRLHQVGVLTDWQYKSLVIDASRAGYRREEGDIERERSQLLPKVMELLKAEGIGLPDIAADLAITLGELRGLIFAPLTSIDGAGQGSDTRHEPPLRLVES